MSSETRKIEGFIDATGKFGAATVSGAMEMERAGEGDNPARAILIIGTPEKPPRVFTEEEVKAFVKEMFTAHFDPGHFTPRHREEKIVGQPFEETLPQWIERAKAIVAAIHGITL